MLKYTKKVERLKRIMQKIGWKPHENAGSSQFALSINDCREVYNTVRICYTMLSAIRSFFKSTLTTVTSTTSPTETTSRGLLMKRSLMRLMWTRPS